MDIGDIIYFTVGATVLLPLGARLAGNQRLARRFDLMPQLSFGIISLALALRRDSTFTYTDSLRRNLGPAAVLPSRILFGALGLFLLGTAVRKIIKRNFDAADPDD